MLRRLVRLAALGGVAGLAAAMLPACASVDLRESLVVTDVLSGWYDNGIKDGKVHLVPSITFRLKNVGAEPVRSVEITAAFWQQGRDGEWDSVLLKAIGGDGLEAGGSTDAITARLGVGYTLEGARADFFTHSQYLDVTAKLFAKRGGRIVGLGEFMLDRRIIPNARTDRATGSGKDAGRP
jgi:hypothetical protein